MPAYLTLKAHPRAVIHNDAGVGKDEAGIAVIAMAEALGVAAATASHASCRIGDAADMMARGVISHANAPARALGVARRHGLPRRGPAPRRRAPQPTAIPSRAGRRAACSSRPDWRRRIVLIDSASLIAPRTRARSSSPPRTAPSSAAMRRWRCGSMPSPPCSATPASASTAPASSRLPALDARGIAGLAVSAASARIGDAASVYEDGIVSHVNATAQRLGARTGEPLKPRLMRTARGADQSWR